MDTLKEYLSFNKQKRLFKKVTIDINLLKSYYSTCVPSISGKLIYYKSYEKNFQH